jgi:ABC transporter DrrB family efflux protein
MEWQMQIVDPNQDVQEFNDPQGSFGVKFRFAVLDTLVLAKRNLLRYVRLPGLLVFSTIQPVIFLLLFTYVFGGAVRGVHTKYVDFLVPGILIQTVAFGSTQTGVGLAEDLQSGIIDRFRSLPMSRSAVLAGRTLADTLRNLIVVLIMVVSGYIIGFRFQNGLGNALLVVLVAVLFGFSLSWISAFTGVSSKNTETANVAGFVWIFPLTFASAAFVPVSTMPGWLQVFAKANPITNSVDALRALTLGGPVNHYLLYSFAWMIGIVVVFAPLAISRYKSRS